MGRVALSSERRRGRLTVSLLQRLQRLVGRWLLSEDADVHSPIHRSAWNRNSANFAITEFSEVRPQEWHLLSGGRHRRGVAQQQLLLRGHDHRRVHTLHPPKLRHPHSSIASSMAAVLTTSWRASTSSLNCLCCSSTV